MVLYPNQVFNKEINLNVYLNQSIPICIFRLNFPPSCLKTDFNLYISMEFLCSACLELLNDPIILSCGNAVCKRCYRVKSVYYSCPVWNCQKTHQFRNEKPNTILREAIETLYPAEYSVFKLVESAERGLEEYLQDACNENLDNKEPVSLESILKSLGNAVEALPYLQLPYIVRAKVLMEMHEFDLALQDAQTAHKLNSWNQRGMVIEKIVNWRKAKYLANLNILSICALSELSSSNKSGNQSVSSENLPSELSLTLAELKNQVADARKTKSEPTLPLSSTFLNSSYQSIPNWGLTASIFECRICWSLLNDPVSAPCGHSWCRDCLVRSIEKSEFCPLCRCKLPSMGYVVCRPKSTVLEHIIGTAFGLSIEKQPPIAKDLIELPIFVCTLVFPHSKPSFHMFEPRYRVQLF